MINVLMDHQIFDMQKFGGVSRYFANIYHYLKKENDYNNEISILKTDNYYLKEDIFSRNPITKYRLKKQKRQFKYNRKYSSQVITANDFDIFHPTYYDPYFLSDLKKPFVLTVHDMIHETYPEFFVPHDQYAAFKRQTINRADHIIAISESTKHDLQQFYTIPDEKITVVYHGVEIVKKQEQSILPGIVLPYVLYVGDRFGYKNFFRFIAAFKKISLIHKDLKLVCTGLPFNHVENEFLIRTGIMDKIIQISATDSDLKSLYQHAVFYINPSLMEGFGFPILEAFENECLTLLGNTSCFREIAGDGAIYFDPFSIDDMADSMLETIQNKNTYQQTMISKMNTRFLKFPLSKSMQETKAVYTRLLI